MPARPHSHTHTHSAAPLSCPFTLFFIRPHLFLYTYSFFALEFGYWPLDKLFHACYSWNLVLATAAIHLVFLIPSADKRIVEQQLRLEKQEKSVRGWSQRLGKTAAVHLASAFRIAKLHNRETLVLEQDFWVRKLLDPLKQKNANKKVERDIQISFESLLNPYKESG